MQALYNSSFWNTFFCCKKHTNAHLQASFLFRFFIFLGPHQHLHTFLSQGPPWFLPIFDIHPAPKEGNQRFIKGDPINTLSTEKMREDLVDLGQAPHSAIIGCADSRVPLETIFDTMPGDIFVLRNAGNTCTHAEGFFFLVGEGWGPFFGRTHGAVLLWFWWLWW